MKAIIMEIYKKYCIVMTEDGQFLKHKIQGGSVEIGDRITIKEKNIEFTYAKQKVWIKGFALGFAALVVLVTGSVFGYRFLKQYLPLTPSAAVADAKSADEDKANVDEEQNEISLGESAAAAADSEEYVENAQQSPLFEKVLSLQEENIIYTENINDILFSYQVLRGEQKVLHIKIENINDALKFEGSILIVLMFEDGSIINQTTIELQDLSPGDIKEENINLDEDAAQFKLDVYGEFH